MNHAFTIIPLQIEAKGEITANNLPEFRELIRAALGNINRDLRSDEDFGQAELDCKALKSAEDAVRAAALAAFDDRIKALVDELNATAEEIRAPRLELEKLIAKRKDEVKSELIEEALASFDIEPALARKTYLAGLQAEIKGKRTLDSMRKALQIHARMAQANITKCREAIDAFERAHGTDLTMDRRTLEIGTPESVEFELRRRFEAKKLQDEKRRLQEEADKAKAELAAAQAKPVDPKNPHDLPAPPKIGSIPVGNVVPMNPAPTLQLTNEITEDEEWGQVTATVKSAFGLIKEHRERLTHDRNVRRLVDFGLEVNKAWKACQQEEVEA